MCVNNVTQVFRFLVCYVCLVLWMPMKKHILAIVYVAVAIMLIMLFGVQQLERSCSVQRNWDAKDRYAISILQGPNVVGHLPP